MIQSIKSFVDFFEKGKEKNVELPKSYKKVKNIVVAGMGASAIPADVLKEGLSLKIPLEVSRKYNLPSYADKNTLLICASRSGETKETLSQLNEGIKKDCKIVIVTCGGKLMIEARRRNIPLVGMPISFIYKETRETFPFFLSVLIKILKQADIVKTLPTLNFLDKNKKNIEKESKKFSKKLLKDFFPIICCESSSVSFRWEGQISENSKKLAESLTIPELAHNEVESWQALNKNYSLIFLRDRKERKEIKALIDGMKKLVKNKVQIFEIYGDGKSKLERILYLIWFGDFVSYFLAKQRKVNFKKNDYIIKLKKEIRKNL